ncbi:hypothetical protein PCASD_01586 [Puccinia coronata f. sp. avenae]|uniref:Uncharacterized protein n=1 Tax=Puccinia coronata f. sp. avenae TaxID=200324 RepID=A0A2N5VIE2_9BASI|nr:hypothetical protein PCASD_01586 [Puccinia coronata f. sp. avenae]
MRVCACDAHPILTAVDRLTELKPNSGLNAIYQIFGILKLIANRQRMVSFREQRIGIQSYPLPHSKCIDI